MKEYTITNIQGLKDNGFRYNYQEKYYSYDFPVYKYKRKPLIFCNIFVYEEDKTVRYEITDMDNNIYASYYNRQYGKNELLTIIDSTIKKEFFKLGIRQKKVGVKNSKLHDEI